MEEEIIKLHMALLNNWAIRGEKAENELQSLMHDDITGFGGALHEVYDDRSGLLNIRSNEIGEVSESPSLDIKWMKSKVYGTMAISWCLLDIKFPADQGFYTIPHMRMSATWVQTDGLWKAVHSHFSKADMTINEGEAFPLEELQARNEELEDLIKEKTLSLQEEKEKAEKLLHNILPVKVANELIKTGKTSSQRFEEVSILFSDFKGFTNIVATIPTRKLIEELNDIFSEFDDIMASYGIEKIKTIGDAYLAVSGLPHEDEQHAEKCVKAAKKMFQFLETRNQASAIKWGMRVGIHSGPIAAGVVGKKKFTYDIFGDAINIASRIETEGQAGQINLSAYTYDLVKDIFPCEYRGKISAKGKGDLDMYFVK